jgi:hypothetical protein
MQEHS